MNERVINNALQFLQRVELKGSESFAFCEVIEEINKLKEKQNDEDTPVKNKTHSF